MTELLLLTHRKRTTTLMLVSPTSMPPAVARFVEGPASGSDLFPPFETTLDGPAALDTPFALAAPVDLAGGAREDIEVTRAMAGLPLVVVGLRDITKRIFNEEVRAG